MSSPLQEMGRCSPGNPIHFITAVDIYKANIDDETVAKACHIFFATHLIKTCENEAKNPPRSTLVDGKLVISSQFISHASKLISLGIDVAKIIDESSARHFKSAALKKVNQLFVD